MVLLVSWKPRTPGARSWRQQSLVAQMSEAEAWVGELPDAMLQAALSEDEGLRAGLAFACDVATLQGLKARTVDDLDEAVDVGGVGGAVQEHLPREVHVNRSLERLVEVSPVRRQCVKTLDELAQQAGKPVSVGFAHLLL